MGHDTVVKGKPGIDWYVVNELFTSVQGEGVLAGRLSTFIRLQGCTVGCSWCDSGPLADQIEGRRTNGETRNTWGRGGMRMSVHDIASRIEASHVVITGGEPTLWNLDRLISIARARGATVQLETAGLKALQGKLKPDHVTWSPKQNLEWNAPLALMVIADEVKWVVDTALTLETVLSTFNLYLSLRDVRQVPEFVLMPEGCPPSEAAVHKALGFLREVPAAWRNHFRFGDRLQYRIGVR